MADSFFSLASHLTNLELGRRMILSVGYVSQYTCSLLMHHSHISAHLSLKLDDNLARMVFD